MLALAQLLSQAGKAEAGFTQLLQQAENICEVCLRCKKPKSRPIVALPTSTKFNETVSLDLKQVNSITFLHMIDTFSRYRAAEVISNKKPDTIIATIFHR